MKTIISAYSLLIAITVILIISTMWSFFSFKICNNDNVYIKSTLSCLFAFGIANFFSVFIMSSKEFRNYIGNGQSIKYGGFSLIFVLIANVLDYFFNIHFDLGIIGFNFTGVALSSTIIICLFNDGKHVKNILLEKERLRLLKEFDILKLYYYDKLPLPSEVLEKRALSKYDQEIKKANIANKLHISDFLDNMPSYSLVMILNGEIDITNLMRLQLTKRGLTEAGEEG